MDVDMSSVGMPALAVSHERHHLGMVLELGDPVDEGGRIRGGDDAELTGMHAEPDTLRAGEITDGCKLPFDEVAQILIVIDVTAACMGVAWQKIARQPMQALELWAGRHMIDLATDRLHIVRHDSEDFVIGGTWTDARQISHGDGRGVRLARQDGVAMFRNELAAKAELGLLPGEARPLEVVVAHLVERDPAERDLLDGTKNCALLERL
jgi:hypothetical protein